MPVKKTTKATSKKDHKKLIIQIPCFNEEKTLPETVQDLPKKVKGFDKVEILIIDDGSKDKTIEVAKKLKVHHILPLGVNRGLATAFNEGITEALRLGADVIVNTDGDNQYPGDRIEELTQPILAGDADIVIGNRRPRQHDHYTPTKKFFHRLGAAVVRKASRSKVGDPVSGFRAISREAALKLNIISTFSYTTEMIIQAGHRGMKMQDLIIEANPKTRESRLFSNIWQFMTQSSVTILRTYATYRPIKVFTLIGAVPLLIGLLPIMRFIYYYLSGQGDGHLQSLLLGSILFLLGIMTLIFGLLADLMARLRQLQELTLETVRRIELQENKK